MANIQEVAEQLCNMTAKEVNELAMIMKDEYGIEPSACAVAERERMERNCRTMSPREYGMQLMNKRNRKRK